MIAVENVAHAVLARYGRTYAGAAGVRLRDQPAPLFRLLVLAKLLAARIGADIAVAAALELDRAGWSTPQRLERAARADVVRALGRGGYRRYDERTATQLHELADRVIDRYGGDLRGLAREADGEVTRAARLLQEFDGIGPTGASVFLREVQAVWPWVRPYLDEKARAGARRVGLPDDGDRLAALVAGDELACFAAALVRVALLPCSVDPLEDRGNPDVVEWRQHR